MAVALTLCDRSEEMVRAWNMVRKMRKIGTAHTGDYD